MVLQVTEEVLAVSFSAARHRGDSFELWHRRGPTIPDLFTLRILRVLRMLRIIRMVRCMHLLRDLRSMIGSVIATLRSLIWTVLLLLGTIYVVSVYITQVVADIPATCVGCVADGTDLKKYFGGIGDTIYTLFMSISGGIDWSQACDPLIQHVSPAMGLVFAGYIGFIMFSMLNVITGIFVDSALKSSSVECEVDMIKLLHDVFELDADGHKEVKRITWDQFETHLEKPQLQAYFKAVDLDVSEARGLFDLVDIEDAKAIDVEDFINGCVRLRGPAKAIDLATVMSEIRRVRVQLDALTSATEELVTRPAPNNCEVFSPEGYSLPRCESGSPDNAASSRLLLGPSLLSSAAPLFARMAQGPVKGLSASDVEDSEERLQAPPPPRGARRPARMMS